jgi:hypothetical protein
MTGLYPIIRRARRPLLPPDEVKTAVVTPPAQPPSSPPLVKLDEAFAEAEKRKGKPGGKGSP